LEQQQRLPGIILLQSPDRISSAKRAVAEFCANVLVLDDGFQHRQMARDLDIVLIDASEPFGFGHLLPRGFLRESISSLRRADVVVLTRAERATNDQAASIRRVVRRYAPNSVWAEASFHPSTLVDEFGTTFSLTEIQSSRVFGFAGIGNPESFRHSLESLTSQLVGFRSFPDHHPFDAADWNDLVGAARTTNAEILVCTCKDLVKIPSHDVDRFPLRAVRIEMQIPAGMDELNQRLLALIQR
jgi:tetraacyldisaccharide 4'-kinase